MDQIPDEILLHILAYRGFGEKRGKNIISLMRVNTRFRDLIGTSLRIEIDYDRSIGPQEFMRNYNKYYLNWKQKRDTCLMWDDYRGFLVITGYDCETWLYYDSLMKRYNFDEKKSRFPFFIGQTLFYD